jgi:hypothetical protein
MDIDPTAPEFTRSVGADPPLDQIAHGACFDEGPVCQDEHEGQLSGVAGICRRQIRAISSVPT